jgi:methylated-DNA-protein-cysteine methyltransferase-like protein
VATYGQIAALAGLTNGARRIGYALHALPPGFPVPWHRVINAQGKISFPPSSQSSRRQKQFLMEEGILLPGGTVDLEAHQWKPKRKRYR